MSGHNLCITLQTRLERRSATATPDREAKVPECGEQASSLLRDLHTTPS